MVNSSFLLLVWLPSRWLASPGTVTGTTAWLRKSELVLVQEKSSPTPSPPIGSPCNFAFPWNFSVFLPQLAEDIKSGVETLSVALVPVSLSSLVSADCTPLCLRFLLLLVLVVALGWLNEGGFVSFPTNLAWYWGLIRLRVATSEVMGWSTARWLQTSGAGDWGLMFSNWDENAQNLLRIRFTIQWNLSNTMELVHLQSLSVWYAGTCSLAHRDY